MSDLDRPRAASTFWNDIAPRIVLVVVIAFVFWLVRIWFG